MSGKSPSLLLGTGLLVGTEHIVEFLEGRFSPDDESSDVTSGGQLEEVESADVSNFNSGDVSQSLDQRNVSSTVDDKRSASASVSSVSKFSLSSSDLDGVDDFLDISPSSNILQESNSLLGSLDLFGGVRHNEREFRDGINSVSSGLNEGKDS